MLKRFSIYSLLLLSLVGCGSDNPVSSTSQLIYYSQIIMGCLDLDYLAPPLQAVVHNQAEYDSLIFERITKPLQDYWNANYDTVLGFIRRTNPGLSDSEYAILVRDHFYSGPPFRGTNQCSNPSIDFSRYTLLGINANSGGCRTPEWDIFVSRDDFKKEITCRVVTVQQGHCSMLIMSNKWILIPRIPDSYKVVFQKETVQGWQD